MIQALDSKEVWELCVIGLDLLRQIDESTGSRRQQLAAENDRVQAELERRLRKAGRLAPQ